jgi:hydrogenase maturation protease
MKPHLLIAGVGNIFHGDDAFGSVVARQLLQVPFPPEVSVVDFGIRGHDLAFALQDGYQDAILIDIAQRGKAPGTLSVIEADVDALEGATNDACINTHGMHPLRLLRLLSAQGAKLPRIWLLTCEPATVSPDESDISLSDAVADAVPEAVALVESLVEKWVL